MNIESMPENTFSLYEKIKKIPEIEEWTLVGGTALAIHIKHRTSEDLDFFINKNKINNVLKRNIEEILSKLVNTGYIKNDLENEDEEFQLDYSLSGVKVTFCVTSSIDLRKDAMIDEYLNIASLDVIAAMKMYTVLNHRIKSRDFYDLKYLIEKVGYTFDGLLLNLQKYFPKYTPSKDRISSRLTKTKLDNNDEGFNSLKLQYKEDFNSLRKYFIKLINEKIYEESIILNEILNNHNEIVLYGKSQKLFDLCNDSLGMKLISLNGINEYKKLLENGLINVEIKNLEGRTILDYLSDINEKELFDKTLEIIDYIPDGLIERLSINSSNKEFIDLIEKHRVINRCIRKDENIVESILTSKDLNIELYKRIINDKKEKLEFIENNEKEVNISEKSTSKVLLEL